MFNHTGNKTQCIQKVLKTEGENKSVINFQLSQTSMGAITLRFYINTDNVCQGLFFSLQIKSVSLTRLKIVRMQHAISQTWHSMTTSCLCINRNRLNNFTVTIGLNVDRKSSNQIQKSMHRIPSLSGAEAPLKPTSLVGSIAELWQVHRLNKFQRNSHVLLLTLHPASRACMSMYKYIY